MNVALFICSTHRNNAWIMIVKPCSARECNIFFCVSVTQVGTVVDNPVDFYHSRVPKKDRKRTMVEELLADAEFRQ